MYINNVTIIRYKNDDKKIVMETDLDWSEAMDWVRQKWFGDLPKHDPKFAAAKKIRDDGLRDGKKKRI